VRSPHAFARIVSIDTAAAAATPGVIAVLTGKDMDGVGNISRHPPLPGRNGTKLTITHRPALAQDRVMHIGEAVALVIGERALIAQDAAESVQIEYEALTPVTDARAALAPGAPQLWPEAPGNLAVDWAGPAADPEANAAEVERIFASAKYVARIAEFNQRLCVASMEPRGATASYDAARDAYTLRTCSQSAGAMRDNVLAIMNWPKEKLRVITEDVGGAFGLKTSAYPEYIALLVAAKRLGRPVHWMSGRSEAFLSDNQARDIYSEAELALDEKGKFLALRIRSVGNMGAYLGAGRRQYPDHQLHPLPAGHVRHQADRYQREMRFTNTLPTAPYRGAGRPESSYALERVVDEAARVTGIDPSQIAAAQPRQEIGDAVQDRGRHCIDSGDFAPILDKALALADYDGFQAPQARGAKARQISRLWHLLHAGTCRRLADRKRVAGISRQRPFCNHGSTCRIPARAMPRCFRLIAERLGIPADKIRIGTAIRRTNCPATPRSARVRR
jgi:carbon-monoxide dehydrogenase large subunit